MVSKFGQVTGKIDHTNAFGITSSIPLVLAGNSTTRLQTSSANTKFLQYYFENTATSGDNRGMYLRLYLSGAGSGGEAARIFTTINDVACGTAHGAHISLNFASTGELTGLGVAMRATLHVPDDAGWTGGTLAAIQAEIFSDGAASDTDGLTEISFIRVVNGGNSSGIADVEDDGFLLSLQGFTSATGNMIYENTTADSDATIRIKIGATTYYMMCKDAEG